MKKILFTIEFLLVLVLFVLPPLMVKSSAVTVNVSIELSVQTVILFVMALLLFFYERQMYDQYYFKTERISVLKKHQFFLVGFGSLLLTSALCQLFTFLLEKSGLSFSESRALLPENFLKWISFILCVPVSAFTEEVVFRFYLPDCFKRYFAQNFYILLEASALILFSFCHMYLGIPAVINAFICGAILRILMIKTKSIYFTTAVHSVYNFTVFIISAVL